jgi:hypothetical protein
MDHIHCDYAPLSSSPRANSGQNECVTLLLNFIIFHSEPDYAVLIVMSVFIFATFSWVTSAHKWFHGPVRNVDEVEKRST